MTPTVLTAAWVRQSIPPRAVDAHKGSSGHLLIVAGSRGMSGAAALCTRGALRAGVGLVTTALPVGERWAVTSSLPEALTFLLPEDAEGHWTQEAIALLDGVLKDRRIHTVAIGPGLGVRPAVRALVRHALREWTVPLVLDADALNNLQASDLEKRPSLVITPHPGEFSRLFQIPIEKVQAEREAIACAMAKNYAVVCVLKGHRSVITDGDTVRVNPTGNSAMATGGMGDVLTGIVASLLTQKLTPFDAASAGVFLHGLSADLRAVSDRGLLASEVADVIPHALHKIGIRR